jgi:hypothetical protein
MVSPSGKLAKLNSIRSRKKPWLPPAMATALFRQGLDDALRSHGWDDFRQLLIGSIEQDVKLSFGAFPSSGQRQHVQICKPTGGRRVRVWYNHVNK